jgi:hypothetical protein
MAAVSKFGGIPIEQQQPVSRFGGVPVDQAAPAAAPPPPPQPGQPGPQIPGVDVSLTPEGKLGEPINQPAPTPLTAGQKYERSGLPAAVQGLGRAALDTAGVIPEALTLGYNAASGLINTPRYGAQLLGGEPLQGWTPYISSPTEMAADAIGSAAKSIGIPVQDSDEMSYGDRLTYNATRFGAGAAGQGAGLGAISRMRPKSDMPRRGDSLIKPYEGKDFAPTLLRDTAGGAGAGYALGNYDSAVGEENRGPLGTILAMLLGSTGGSTLADVAMGGPTKAVSMARRAGIDKNIPYDLNNQPTSRATAEDAGRYMQGAAGGPEAARGAAAQQDITLEEILGYGAPPVPLGQATQNVGLARVERAVTNTDKGPSVIDRNREVTTWAGDKLKGIKPQADEEQFVREATGQRDQMIGGARQGVATAEQDAATAAAQRAQEGEQFAAQYGGRAAPASQELSKQVVDERMVPTLEKSAAMYDAADPQGVEMVPTDDLIDTARRVRDTLGSLNDPAKVIPRGLLARIEAAAGTPENPVPPEASIRDLVSVIPEISNTMTRARNAQNYQLVDNLRALRDGIERAIEGPPTSPAPLGPPYDRYQAMITDLDARGAPDIEYRNILSTSSKRSLSRGETWRGRVQSFIEIGRKKQPPAGPSRGPGAEQALAARQNYRDTVAPVYSRGAGDPATDLRKDFNQNRLNRSNTPPSQVAGRFLQPGQPEKAQSLGRVLDGADSPAAREFVLAHAADSVVRNGVINSQALGQFTSKWGPVIDHVPGLRAEVDRLVGQARRGEATEGLLANVLKGAQGRLKLTEQEVADSALAIVAGTTPQKAIEGIISSRNPPAQMRDLRTRLAGVPGAHESLQRAAADWLYRKVTNTTTGMTTDGSLPPSLAKMVNLTENPDQMKVLAEVFDPSEMMAFRQVRKVLDLRGILQAAQGTPGSATASNLDGMVRIMEAGLRTLYGGFRGGNMTRNIKVGLSTLLKGRDNEVQELVARTMTDPRISKHLLSMELAKDPTAWSSKMNKLLRREEVARQINDEFDDDEK